MADCTRCRHWFLLISSFIGMFMGIAGCFVFSFTFRNYEAGFLAGFSGLLSALCLHLELLDHFSRLYEWYNAAIFRRLSIFCSVMLLVALGLLSWYLYNIISKHEGFYPIETSDPCRAVMTFFNIKWAITLLCLAEKHRKHLTEEQFSYQTLPVAAEEGTSAAADADA